MADRPGVWSAARLAEFLEITPRRLQQLVDEGYGQRLDRDQYDFISCVRGYIRFWKERAEGRQVMTALDEEKYLTAKVQRRRKELELLEYEGTLVTKSAHKKALAEAFDFVRSNLQNMIGAVAPQLVGMDTAHDVVAVLEPTVSHALSSLVARADDVRRMDELPDELPGVTYFRRANVTTWSALDALEDLRAVPGIGPKTKKQVQAYRQEHGR